jgi:hypothetical protein
MIECVGIDDVTRESEGADDTQIRSVGAGEQQASLGAEPVSELTLELQMLRRCSGDQPRGSSPEPDRGRRFT